MATAKTLRTYTPHGSGALQSGNADVWEIADSGNQYTLAWAFDSGSDEGIIIEDVMPLEYENDTGITLYLHCAAAATTGNVVIDVEFENQDAAVWTTDNFATEVTQTSSMASAANYTNVIISFDVDDTAEMDSVVAGDSFRMILRRDGDDASDTLAVDWYVSKIEMRERV